MFNAVLSLGEDYRKFFFLNKCEENEVICFLKEKGEEGTPLFFEDEPEKDEEEGLVHTMMPVWCHPRFVDFYLEHSFKGNRDDYETVSLKLSLFKESWIPALQGNNIALAVMPMEEDKDFCIEDAGVFLKSPEERQKDAEKEAEEIRETVRKELKN